MTPATLGIPAPGNAAESAVEVHVDEAVVTYNLSQMNGPMARLLRNESLGGNAGRVTLGGRRYYACAAAHGYANPATGRIAAFGSFQDVPPAIRTVNAEFTLKVAFGGLRFFRIVEFLPDNSGDGPRLSPDARDVIEETVHRWNEARERGVLPC
jgi:hypothetical protein